MVDQVANFKKVTVSIGYDAAATSIVLESGAGAELPDPSGDNYNVVWWDSVNYPDPADDPNVEVVRITAKSTDTLTVTRNQESSGASTKNTANTTYKMIVGLTAKHITDLNTLIAANIANVVEDTTPQLGGILDSNAKQIRWSKGADVASSNALTLGTDGNYFDITGTTTITSISTLAIGTLVCLHFDGILTLTHNATDLILSGAANITTAAGDEAILSEYATGDWRCISYIKASGQAVVGGISNANVTDLTDAGNSTLHYHASDRLVANISDMDEQSFTNLLLNGDFESWSAGAATAPDQWTASIGGGGAIVREGTIVKHGTYSAKLTNGVATIAYINQTNTLNDSLEPDYLSGRTITLGCWIYTDTASRVRLHIYDVAGTTENTSSEAHTGDSTWQWITVTRTLRSSLTSILVRTVISAGTAISAYSDGMILVEGSVCPAFSPKPLVDDGKTLVIDGVNNKVTSMKQVYIPSSNTAITAAGGITVTHTIMRVAGSGGAIDITADPQIVAGTDGQIVIIQGTHDTNTVTLDDGTGLALSAQCVLAAQDNITLMYDSGDSEWIEIARTTVT